MGEITLKYYYKYSNSSNQLFLEKHLFQTTKPIYIVDCASQLVKLAGANRQSPNSVYRIDKLAQIMNYFLNLNALYLSNVFDHAECEHCVEFRWILIASSVRVL